MANDLVKFLVPFLGDPNVRAMGHVVREGESNQTDDAYRMVNGGTFIDSFTDHPYRGLRTTQGGRAAGAYQAIPSTWEDFIKQCGERDFSPPSQDLFFVWALNKRQALQDVAAGRFYEAVVKCRLEWTSLPGAAENSGRYTLEKARAVYLKYGGKEEAQQPAAPIIDESTTIPKETVMPSSLDSIAGLVSIINPAAGGVVGLAGKLLEMFSPKTVAKIDAQLGAKRTDVASEAATLVEQAKVLTGKADGFDAVAAARADPTVMAKLEQTAEQRMDTLIKAADKTAGYDQSLWAAQNEGRRVVSSIAIEEHRAGLWDMTKTLVMTACAIALLGSLALLGAIIYQSVMKTIDPVLLALAGPLLTITFGAIGVILAYRFDGTKDASAQTKALISAATDKTGA